MKNKILITAVLVSGIFAHAEERISLSCEQKIMGSANHLYRTNYFHESPLGGKRLHLVERLSNNDVKYFVASFPSALVTHGTAEREIGVKVSSTDCAILEVVDLQN